ncbi:MAG: SDR family NAD(P)-dependent oxidoreductase, partial [Acidimicrobiia bacterium]|nr:SDR family NAD(P)-dependent oxidoreductase [Acidimicrobiia bacterium]
GIERDDSLALRDFPTMAHVVQFVYDHRPDLAAFGQASPVTGHRSPAQSEESSGASGEERVASSESGSEPGSGERVAGSEQGPGADGADMDAVLEIPRRVPVAVLRPSLKQCARTGAKLKKGSRVVVMPDQGGVAAALKKRLEKRAVKVLMLDPTRSVDEVDAQLDKWQSKGEISGVYWLPALDDAGNLEALSFDEWREALRVRVKLLYTAMRRLYGTVGEPGTFLVAATRLGGRHGYDAHGATAPLGGAVTGFTKTFKRERPDATVKAVDFAATGKTKKLAKRLIAETLADPGAVEIGYAEGRRWTVALQEESAETEEPGIELGPDTVFVITGAAGSITSAITADLAGASGGTFHLLDLTPEPDPADPDLVAFAADKEGLKRTIFERIKASGERATPAMVDRELAALERLDAARSAISAVEAAGGTAHYHSVNLLDHEAVRGVVERVREESGRIDVLIHAGGLEISHLLPDKPPEQFDLVFDVKADGWFSLMSAIGDMPLGATVGFSSIAGRFGNAGQADYSAANDLLCKVASSFRRTRPDTRGIAIDWTAWGDIGMATRGSIPTVMKAAGIDMLPAAAGIPFIRRELTAGTRSGEVLVGQSLGLLLEDWDARGGLASKALAASSPGVMVGEVKTWSPQRGLLVETRLDPAEQGFLNDHRIDGIPVLPGVMGMEAFAEVAGSAFPDLVVASVEDVDFLAPFKFYRDEPRVVAIEAQFSTDGGDIVADCRLIGSRKLPNQEEPQVTVHFTGRVRLAAEAAQAPTMNVPAGSANGVAPSEIYGVYFHGPAYQVLDRAWRAGMAAVGRFNAGLPDNHQPADLPLRSSPRLVELCFQTAGIWEMGTGGVMGLPMHVERASLFGRDNPVGELMAVAEAQADDSFRVRVVDEDGTVHVDLDGYRTVRLPGAASAEVLEPLQRAMELEG